MVAQSTILTSIAARLRTESDNYSAMATVISSQLAITTSHAIFNSPREYTLELDGPSGPFTIPAEVLRQDDRYDLVLLRLLSPVDKWLAPPSDVRPDFSYLQSFNDWKSFYKGPDAPEGKFLHGTIGEHVPTDARDYLSLIPATGFGPVSGLSGAPVISEERLIGIMAASTSEVDLFYAVPTVEMIKSSLWTLITEATGQTTTTSREFDGITFFKHLSEPARTALESANAIRLALASNERIHMEHLLAGLFKDPNGTPREAFQKVGIDELKLTTIIKETASKDIPLDREYEIQALTQLPLISKHVQQAFVAANDAAKNDEIKTGHLLFGVLSVDDCDLAKALRSFGLKKEDIELEPVPKPPPEIPLPEIKPQLPSIDADTPSLVDHLNIKAEVRGFANIVAARDVKTPLSIGLFGDWGSGKSTFMEQLQRAVEGIATEVREKPADQKSVFLGNIVQIKFNAWHYVEANLWASLVSHIFDNLSFSEQEEKAKAENRKQLFLSKLSSTLEEQRKAELNAQAKQEEYQRANNALQEARRQQDNARVKLSQVLSESIWPEVKRLIAANPQAAGAIKDARDLLSQNELSEEELRRELRDSRNTMGRIQWRFKAMMDDPRRGLFIIGILLATFLLPIGLALLISWLVGSQLLTQTIAGITPLFTVLAGIMTWLKAKRPAANKVLDRLDQAEQMFNEILVQARSRHDLTVEKLQQRVNAAEGAIQTAGEQVKQLDKQKTEVLNSLREMEPARVLENFVQERASSKDYRELLGVVALIRRDFKRLSDMLREQDNRELRDSVAEILKRNEKQAAPGAASASLKVQLAGALVEQIQDQASETNLGAAANTDLDAVGVAATAAPGKPTASVSGNGQDLPVKTFERQVEETLKDYRIDRIVLYIDDLDRCPPKQVVDVLQAIHLLLAFELFVVVVGVDARWVRHSLRKHYPELLDEDLDDQKTNGKKETRWTRAATPRDYVEKIFQIPFWIKPMEPGDSEKLFKALIPDAHLTRVATTEKTGKTPSGDQSTTGSTAPANGSSPASSGEENEITQRVETETDPAGSTVKPETDQSEKTPHDDEPKASKFDLSPESLLLDRSERNLMVAIGNIIGKSPRTVKRFVNIYRIIKAGLDAERLAAFKGTDGRKAEYPAVLVLLSIAHGQPELTPTFFRALKLRYEKKPNLTLKTFIGEAPYHNQGPAEYPVQIDDELKEGWAHLIDNLNTFCDEQKIDIPLETLNKWLPVIVRYTFQLGRLSGEIRESSIR